MFTLSESSHAVVRKITKILLGVIFVVAVAVLGTNDIQQYRKAQSILVDAVTVDAGVELLEIVEKRGRRGRRSNEFHFGYSFEAGGETYGGTFETSESGAEPYLQTETVSVMYAKANPSNFALASDLERVASIGAVLKKLAFEVLVALVVLALIYWAITGRLFKKEDVPPVPAAA